MTREEYEKFRDEVLKERFLCCYSSAEKKYLLDKGYRYLFRCTHMKTNRFFWVFDKTDALMKDVVAWTNSHKKSREGVSSTAIEG